VGLTLDSALRATAEKKKKKKRDKEPFSSPTASVNTEEMNLKVNVNHHEKQHTTE
jgi:hypothetical protein